jgi:HPt (histidine-containing phosphotransfer) domain-containing protein
MSEVHLDRERLDLMRELGEPGEPDPVVELIEVFELQTQQLVAALQASRDSGDHETMRKTAHSLKGSSGNLGAMRLAELSRLLESQATGPSSCDDLVKEILEEVQVVSSLLRAEAEKTPTN